MSTTTLEQKISQTLSQKPAFLQRIRSSLARRLMPYLAASTFALAGCGQRREPESWPTSAQSCDDDYDCPGDALCQNGFCTTGGQQSCDDDYDCPGEEVCKNNVCVSSETLDPSAVPAGTVGKCVEVEIYPGYVSCVMDQVQNFEGEISQKQSYLGEELPPYVNHRTEYIDSNCPEVHSQGKCGWCVAHATTAAMEAIECKEERSERISEPHLWYLGGGEVRDCSGGWFIIEAMRTAKENKLTSHSVWPYSTKEGEMSSTKPSEETLRREGKFSIDDYVRIGHDIEALKSALAGGHNVVLGVPIFCDSGWLYKNTEGRRDRNIGNIMAPPHNNIEDCVSSEESFEGCSKSNKPFCLVGYHAVLLVGYDDETEQFILRNSWGTDWAEGGYSNISFDYIERFGRGGAYPKDDTCTPTGAEICNDGIDNDCNGKTDNRDEACGQPSCQNDCSPQGQKQCLLDISNGYKTCGNYDQDECLEWGSLTRCEDNEYCNNGRCVEEEPTCRSHANKTCYNDDVYWRDSCGNREERAENCSANQNCENGRCVDDCDSHASRVCNNGDVYWQDSCGDLEERVQDCNANQNCENGQCVAAGRDCDQGCGVGQDCCYGVCGPNGCMHCDDDSDCRDGYFCDTSQNPDTCVRGQRPNCNPHASRVCDNGDVYWRDSCGNLEERAQDCNANQNCENGQCVAAGCAADEYRCSNTGRCISRNWLCDGDNDCGNGEDERNCEPQCNSHASRACHNNDVYWRDSCGNLEERAENCSAYQYCEDGRCVEDRDAGGRPDVY